MTTTFSLAQGPYQGSSFLARSLATVTLSGPLGAKIDAAAAAGFDGIELCQCDLEGCSLTAAQVADAATAAGLRIFLWQPLRDIEGVPAGLFAANLARARDAISRARQLGTGTIVVCSNTSPDADGDFGRAAGQLGELADLAAGDGIQVAYEALSWGTFVYTYRHAWQLVRAAGRPNLGICLDSFHILARGEDLGGIARIPAGKITAVQVADAAPRDDLDYLHWSRHHRCFPGRGVLDVAGFTRAVLAAGYRGPLALEIFSDQHRDADPGMTAAAGMRALTELEQTATGGVGGSAWFPGAGGLSHFPGPADTPC
jgi:4-hydroxyphenylpyruvate dioxygenase